jgi:hypothetical protein
MGLDLEAIKNHIDEVQSIIIQYEISEREKQELEEMRREASEEGAMGTFIVPTAEGFRIGEVYYPKLGVHIRGWKKYWHRWTGNKKEIAEQPSAQDIEKKGLKRGADLTIQVLEPADALGTYTLSLAPTSYYNFRAYIESLGNKGLEPHKVLTVLGYRMRQYEAGNPVALVLFSHVPFNAPGRDAEGTTETVPAEWQ